MFLDEYVACRPTKNVYKLAITQVSDTASVCDTVSKDGMLPGR
jgi:hypothetical protein